MRSDVEQRLLDRAGKARELLERQCSAADAGDGLLDLAADQAGEAFGALPYRCNGLGEHPQHGHLGARPLGIEGNSKGSLEGRQRELVGGVEAR